ncbi:MAG: hypothetical protein RJB37_765 [Pseudomonadota bacterium]
MRPLDILAFARDAATGSPVRTLLMTLAMSIGVAAVVLLTALGDGARRYVVDQFSSIGTNLVIVLPGRSQTGGFSPANAVSTTPRDLTIDDAHALLRLASVQRVAPLAVGLSEVALAGRLRETMVLGTTAEYLAVRRMAMGQGRFLPEEDWGRGSPVVVLGSKLRSELFGADNPLGQTVRIGGRRLRVVGVLASAGQSLGMNADEVAIVPVALAQAMFDSNTLFRILIEARDRDAIPAAKRQATALIKTRHDGEEDVTVITQDAVLATFDRVLGALTAGVAGVAAISLAVAGVLVMNVMLVSVRGGAAVGGGGRGRLPGRAGGCVRGAHGLPDLSGLAADVGGGRGAWHGAVHRRPVRRAAGAQGGSAGAGGRALETLKAPDACASPTLSRWPGARSRRSACAAS